MHVKAYADTTVLYHQHTNTPPIETYYPRPGPYARQRARLAAEAAGTREKLTPTDPIELWPCLDPANWETSESDLETEAWHD
jgi:hypothetical protein